MPWKPKPGVDLSKLREEITRLEPIVCDVFSEVGKPAVVTSANDGKHGKNSYHYKDAAIDLRSQHFGGVKAQQEFHARLKHEIDLAWPGLYDTLLELKGKATCRTCGESFKGHITKVREWAKSHAEGHGVDVEDHSHFHLEVSPLLAKIMFGPPREVA